MQFIVISHQIWETALGLLLGAFLGLSYDGVRFVRCFVPSFAGMLFANLFDIIFGVYSGSVYCIFIYYASSGRFRWFTALAFVLGFFLYRVSVGRLVKHLAYSLASGILKLLGYFLIPARFLFSFCSGVVLSTARRSRHFRELRRYEKFKRQLKDDIIFNRT